MLTRLLKNIAYQSPAARLIAPRYIYLFRPAQLAYLVSTLDDVRDVKGCVVEAGCFVGATTIYLREHLKDIGQRKYVAIDTFDGFVPTDVDHELQSRGKGGQESNLVGGFSLNRKQWMEKSLQLAGHSDVQIVQADVGALDYKQFGPIAFALIDVDLYLPVQRALERIAPHMSPGGRIIVDDCKAENVYDGALQAYTEFCTARGQKPEIVHEKLGVLRF